MESHWILNARSLAKELLNKAVESEDTMDQFDSFSTELIKTLESACKEEMDLSCTVQRGTKCGQLFIKPG